MDNFSETTENDVLYGLGDLVLSTPVQAKYILEVTLWEAVNCHGKAHIKFVPTEFLSFSEILKLENHSVHLQTAKGEGIFQGIVLSVELRSEGDYQEITLVVGTESYSDDIIKNSAVFQDKSKSLSQITASLSSSMVNLTDDVEIPEILFQNKETGFEFVRRIANEYGQFLMVDSKRTGNPIYVGNSPIQEKELGYFQRISFQKPIHSIEKLKYHREPSAQGFEFAEEHLEIWDPSVGVGTKLTYKEQEMLVVSTHLTTENGVLLNHIALVGHSGQIPTGKFAFAQCPRGFILEAVVEAVEQNIVKVKFFEKEERMAWLPYENTVNNYCYAMPDIGDRVFVYHRGEDTSKNFAFSSKFEDNSHDDFNIHETKVLTSENSMIQFQNDTVNLSGNRSMFDSEGTECISLKDSGGIEIFSKDTISLESKGDLILFAGGSHNGMLVQQTKFVAMSGVGTAMLAAGAGVAASVATPSTGVSSCQMAIKPAISMVKDFKKTLSDLEETLTKGNSSKWDFSGTILAQGGNSFEAVVGSTHFLVRKNKIHIQASAFLSMGTDKK